MSKGEENNNSVLPASTVLHKPHGSIAAKNHNSTSPTSNLVDKSHDSIAAEIRKTEAELESLMQM